MLLVYTPAEGERQEFVFRPLEIDELDAEEIEEIGVEVRDDDTVKTYWVDYDDFGRAFFSGRWRALRAALWVSMRAANPGLGFDQVRFKINEVDIFLEDHERETIKARLHEGSLTVEEAEEAKAVLAKTMAVEPGKDEPDDSDTNST